MVGGLILKDSLDEDSVLAVIGDETRTFSASTNEELADLFESQGIDVVAVNAPMNLRRSEFNEQEEQLRDEGHIFQPSSSQKTLARRLEALKDIAFERMGSESPDFVRFDPQITSKELAIEGDEGLESLGVAPDGIESAEEFDAVLGAVTSRFYQQNQFEEKAVVIPEPLSEEDQS
ncbi:MAG: hypothetical protein ABEJ03_05265 [Candidatus Nanohaloarchaea archaeon]